MKTSELPEENKRKVSEWTALSEKSLKKLWDNKNENKIWSKYL